MTQLLRPGAEPLLSNPKDGAWINDRVWAGRATSALLLDIKFDEYPFDGFEDRVVQFPRRKVLGLLDEPEFYQSGSGFSQHVQCGGDCILGSRGGVGDFSTNEVAVGLDGVREFIEQRGKRVADGSGGVIVGAGVIANAIGDRAEHAADRDRGMFQRLEASS